MGDRPGIARGDGPATACRTTTTGSIPGLVQKLTDRRPEQGGGEGRPPRERGLDHRRRPGPDRAQDPRELGQGRLHHRRRRHREASDGT
ncbi:MAG: hypothetical protein MZV64_10665 [Ignavibacteriales bacterium]|nr:hypothetical protein [Ignavibacteriales bacterium]